MNKKADDHMGVAAAERLTKQLRVFNTHQTISFEGGEIVTAPAISDHTLAVINHMTSVRIEAAVKSVVSMNILGEIAQRMNKTGRGLLADRMDLAGDGVSQLAVAPWSARGGYMRVSRKVYHGEPGTFETAGRPTRDLWNGDEGNDNVSMH